MHYGVHSNKVCDVVANITFQRAQLDDIQRALTDVPAEVPGEIYVWTDCIWVNLPYDVKTLRAFRGALGQMWQPEKRESFTFVSSNGTAYRRYVHGLLGVKLIVTLATTRAGSTCHRVKVGERREPIYEVVCS